MFAILSYSFRKWRQLGVAVGKELKMEGRLHQGVYTMLGGPNYETVAELRMLRVCGVDAVGRGKSILSTLGRTYLSNHFLVLAWAI